MLQICLTSTMEHINSSDMEIIEKAILSMKVGDLSGMEQVFSKTSTAVYAYTLSIVKNRHDAEDILQETYIRLYQAAGSYVSNGKPMPWILTIAKNLALMNLRNRKKTGNLDEEDWKRIPFEEESLSPEDRMILSDMLGALTDEERRIVLLHVSAGLKHRETAELLDIPLATALAKYHRAIKKMQKMYMGERA